MNHFSPSSTSNRLTAIHAARIRLFVFSAAVSLFAFICQPARGFEILFDYSYDDAGFFGATEKNALESAASYFEGIIGDDFDAITPGGLNTWDALFFDPETLLTTSVTDMVVPADTIIIFVGSRNLGGALGVAQPGGHSAIGFASFLDTVEKRGEIGTVSGASADEVAPWGGVISFDSSESWNFDDEAGPGATGTDFDFRTVALHEIGHVLGHGIVDSYTALINGSNQFTGTKTVAEYGGVVSLTGDSHFASSTISTVYGGTDSQSAIMVASLADGTRREVTAVDVASLDDIGYDVVPEPTSALLLLTAGATFLFRRPRRVV